MAMRSCGRAWQHAATQQQAEHNAWRGLQFRARVICKLAHVCACAVAQARESDLEGSLQSAGGALAETQHALEDLRTQAAGELSCSFGRSAHRPQVS